MSHVIGLAACGILIAIVGIQGFLIWMAIVIAWAVFLHLFTAVAVKAATDNGAISKFQKQDERRYMPKELLEKIKV